MRVCLTSAVLAAVLATAAASPASAQGQPKPGQTMVHIAKGSPLARVFFPEPGLVLDDDGTFSGAMQRLGREVSRDCGAVETYGWDFKEQSEEQRQKHSEQVFEGTLAAFRKGGYTLTERKVRAIPDPASVVFLADGKANRLNLLWVPEQDALLLVVCDAGLPSKPPASDTPAKKK